MPNVLRIAELRSFINGSRDDWKTPKSLGNDDVIDVFESIGLISKVEIPFHDGTSVKPLYAQSKATSLQVALALRPDSYVSHASAASVHRLTRNLQKFIYVTKEQSEKPPRDAQLSQEAMDLAFKKPQRVSSEKYVFEDSTLVLLNGKFTGDLGVGVALVAGDEVRVTRIERTLIDMTVRPDYSGGVYQVLEAFERVVDQVSVAALMSLLNRLQFIYPYHQAIGFYMEKAGYPEATCNRLRSYGLKFDFYLAHAMKETVFDTYWRLHLPVGMEIVR